MFETGLLAGKGSIEILDTKVESATGSTMRSLLSSAVVAKALESESNGIYVTSAGLNNLLRALGEHMDKGKHEILCSDVIRLITPKLKAGNLRVTETNILGAISKTHPPKVSMRGLRK